MIEQLKTWLSSTGNVLLNRLLPCLLILVVGMIINRIILTIINKSLKKSRLEKAAHSLIRSVVRVVLYALLILTAASSLGINVTGVVAVASVASLALSLALQNSLTNLIGGFTLLYTKPFRSGDYVEIAGQAGTVQEIGMAYTKLTTADNKLVSIPNSSVVATEIVNYSCTGTRRVEVNVSAAYTTPVEQVLAALTEAATIPEALEDPAPFAAVTRYGESAIEYTVRIWCKTDDYWTAWYAVTGRVKEIFDREGLKMTYPHLNVHLDK